MSQSEDINYDKIVEETILKNNERHKCDVTKRTVKQAYEEAHINYDKLACYHAKLKAQWVVNKTLLIHNKSTCDDLISTRIAIEKTTAQINEKIDNRLDLEQILGDYRNGVLQLNEKYKTLDASMDEEILRQKQEAVEQETDKMQMLIQYTQDNLKKVSERTNATTKTPPDVSQLNKTSALIHAANSNTFGYEKTNKAKLDELKTSVNFLEKAIFESNAKYDVINTKLNAL